MVLRSTSAVFFCWDDSALILLVTSVWSAPSSLVLLLLPSPLVEGDRIVVAVVVVVVAVAVALIVFAITADTAAVVFAALLVASVPLSPLALRAERMSSSIFSGISVASRFLYKTGDKAVRMTLRHLSFKSTAERWSKAPEILSSDKDLISAHWPRPLSL